MSSASSNRDDSPAGTTRGQRRWVVVGPDLDARGGITSVLRIWADEGLIGGHENGTARFHASTADGSGWLKLVRDPLRWIFFALFVARSGTIVHLHAASGASFWRKSAYAAVTLARGGRFVLHVHPQALVDRYESSGRLARALMRRTFTRATRLVAVSPRLAERIALALPVRDRVEVIFNPIRRKLFSADAARQRKAAQFLYLGWFVPSKGISELLDAFVRIRSTHPAARLVLGGHRNETWLREEIHSRGLEESVDQRGWIDADEVEALLRTCTALVLPSHSEGMPMVVLEAMACATPIITCPVGAISEILEDGRSALLVPPRDVDRLAAAMRAILDDPELGARIGSGARAAAEPFRSTLIADRVRSLWGGVATG